MGALPFSPLLLHTPSPDRAFLQQNKVFYEKASCGEAPPHPGLLPILFPWSWSEKGSCASGADPAGRLGAGALSASFLPWWLRRCVFSLRARPTSTRAGLSKGLRESHVGCFYSLTEQTELAS